MTSIDHFVRLETIDGGEIIIPRTAIRGLDSRVKGLQNVRAVICSLDRDGINIQLVEVSQETYDYWREELLDEAHV